MSHFIVDLEVIGALETSLRKRLKPDEIKLRYSITSAFGINVLCSARSNIADKLTVKFYSDISGLSKDKFIKARTERTRLAFNKIIFDLILI